MVDGYYDFYWRHKGEIKMKKIIGILVGLFLVFGAVGTMANDTTRPANKMLIDNMIKEEILNVINNGDKYIITVNAWQYLKISIEGRLNMMIRLIDVYQPQKIILISHTFELLAYVKGGYGDLEYYYVDVLSGKKETITMKK